MAIEDDDKPRKKVTHEIGQDLSLLSVEELDRAHRADDFRDRAAAGGDDQKARIEGRGQQLFQIVAGSVERPRRGNRLDAGDEVAKAASSDRIRPMADMANKR